MSPLLLFQYGLSIAGSLFFIGAVVLLLLFVFYAVVAPQDTTPEVDETTSDKTDQALGTEPAESEAPAGDVRRPKGQ